MQGELPARVRALARTHGFTQCGFAAADAPAPGSDAFGAWLTQGRHGDMRWMERTAAKRSDPAQVLPGARAVIALLVDYGAPAPPRAAGSGVIARYARGRDYHKVVTARLKRLCAALADIAGGAHAFRWYVDTGPVLEKPWAQRAGLGWIGKHTNLVSSRLGSWTFCAEILTTLPLPPDAPHADRCGSCRRCLPACPTQAITAPYQLDARRCISYLTIELRGPIPREFRAAIGDRVYGCDDCLAVCPWNRFAAAAAGHAAADPDLAPRPGQSFLDLTALLALTEADYAERFHGTALTRAKRSGLRRNAAVALGNTGGPAAVPPLVAALQDDDPLVRGHAAWALGRLGGDAARAALEARAAIEPDGWVREELTLALAAL
ncbi:MAG: tRNA epoxyqueuosine(34) reductase QueG [Planctomycetota bacterium]